MSQRGERKKTIWLVAGSKGGVGKSLFCLLLASALEIRRETFAVLDGDGRTSDVYHTFLRKAPAVAVDFRKLQPNSPMDPLDAAYERQVSQLIKSSQNLIINTPDGADDIIMDWFDVTLQHRDTADVVFKLVYMMSDRSEGIRIIPEMMRRFPLMYPIKNLFFGKPSDFIDFDAEYAKHFNRVLLLPKLRQEELRTLFAMRTYPTEAIRLKRPNSCYTLPVLSRIRIMDWVSDFFTDCERDLFDNLVKPNLVKQHEHE